MTKYYLMLLIATLLLAGEFSISKIYQKKAGTSLKAGFFFNAMNGLFSAIIFFAVNGFKLHVSLYSIVMASLFSLMLLSYSLIGFRILKRGSMALYTLFLMTGGMTVPYVWGLLFLNEEFSWLRTGGLCVLICAVALTAFDGKRNKIAPSTILMCLAIFFLNGFTSVFSKLHQVEALKPNGFETVETLEFVFLTGLTKFVMAGIAFLIAYLYEKKKQGASASEENSSEPKVKAHVVLPIILLGSIVSGITYFLQLVGASNLPATVLYPFITGGSMVFSTVVGILCFKEKPSKTVILSICLCFIGTLMFL